MIENRKARVFHVTMYYAVCHDCRTWIKSSTGQLCWNHREGRNRNVRQHRQIHQ